MAEEGEGEEEEEAAVAAPAAEQSFLEVGGGAPEWSDDDAIRTVRLVILRRDPMLAVRVAAERMEGRRSEDLQRSRS